MSNQLTNIDSSRRSMALLAWLLLVHSALILMFHITAHEILLQQAAPSNVYGGDCRSADSGPCMLPVSYVSGTGGMQGMDISWAVPVAQSDGSFPSEKHWPFVSSYAFDANVTEGAAATNSWLHRTFDLKQTSVPLATFAQPAANVTASTNYTTVIVVFPFDNTNSFWQIGNALRAIVSFLIGLQAAVLLLYHKWRRHLWRHDIRLRYASPAPTPAVTNTMIVLELIALIIHVPPFYEHWWLSGNAEKTALHLYLFLLSTPLITHTITAVTRVLYWESALLSSMGTFFSRITHNPVSLRLVWAAWFRSQPMKIAGIGLAAVFAALCYVIRNAEALVCSKLSQDVVCEPLGYGGAAWLTSTTMLSLGYGSPYRPYSVWGKLMTSVATILCIVLWYYLFIGLWRWLRSSPTEAIVIDYTTRLYHRQRMRKAAVTAVVEYWRYRRSFARSVTWSKGLGLRDKLDTEVHQQLGGLLSPNMRVLASTRERARHTTRDTKKGGGSRFTFEEVVQPHWLVRCCPNPCIKRCCKLSVVAPAATVRKQDMDSILVSTRRLKVASSSRAELAKQINVAVSAAKRPTSPLQISIQPAAHRPAILQQRALASQSVASGSIPSDIHKMDYNSFKTTSPHDAKRVAFTPPIPFGVTTPPMLSRPLVSSLAVKSPFPQESSRAASVATIKNVSPHHNSAIDEVSRSSVKPGSIQPSVTNKQQAGISESYRVSTKHVTFMDGASLREEDGTHSAAPLLAAVLAGRQRQKEEEVEKQMEMEMEMGVSAGRGTFAVPKSLQRALARRAADITVSGVTRGTTLASHESEDLTGGACLSFFGKCIRRAVRLLCDCKLRVVVVVRPISKRLQHETTAVRALAAFAAVKKAAVRASMDTDLRNAKINRAHALSMRVEVLKDSVHNLMSCLATGQNVTQAASVMEGPKSTGADRNDTMTNLFAGATGDMMATGLGKLACSVSGSPPTPSGNTRVLLDDIARMLRVSNV